MAGRVLKGLFALFLIAFAAISCEKNESLPQEAFQVRAYTGATVANPLTRTTVNDDLSINWESGEQLSIVAYTSGGVSAVSDLTLKEGANTERGMFEGTVNISDVPEKCYFIYPASSSRQETQYVSIDAAAGTATFSYDNQTGEHNPYLASTSITYNSSGIDVTLEHIGGVLAVSLPDNIQKITVQGNQGEKLSGYKYNFKNGTGEVDENGTTSFSVAANGNGTYYINMPPVAFTKGFTLLLEGPDGAIMYKSFNYGSGGCDFSKSAEAGQPATAATLKGALIEIDVDSFEPLALTSATTASHTYDGSGTLTGSEVKISGITLQGVPASLVTNYKAELKNSNGTTVREYAGSSVPASDITMNTANNWPYLPQGSYTLTQTITTIYGTTETTSTVTLGAPTLAATTDAKTSYSYYTAGNINQANNCDNSTIYNITVEAKISADILGNSNYASLKPKAQYKIDSGSLSEEVSMDAASHNFGNISSQSWTSHTITGIVNFDGATATATKNVEITGLPYDLTFNNNNAGWSLYNYDWSSGFLTLDSNKNDNSRGYAISPKFNIPADIKCNYSVYAYYYCSLVSAGNCTIWIEPTSSASTKSQSSSGHYKSSPKIALPITAEFDNNTGALTFSKSSPYLSISHNLTSGTWQSRYVCVKSVTLLYTK